MAHLCFVANCGYVASATIEEFEVCALHDHAAVRRILDALQWPGAFFGPDDRPLVVPVGELAAEHFIPVEPRVVREPLECPLILSVPDGPSRVTHAQFDLTRES